MFNDEQEQGNSSTFRRRSYLEDNEVSNEDLIVKTRSRSEDFKNENTLIDFLTNKMGQSDQISRAQLQMVFDKIIREESDPARKNLLQNAMNNKMGKEFGSEEIQTLRAVLNKIQENMADDNNETSQKVQRFPVRYKSD